MADTVDIPQLGPVKKNWLIAGGALVAGIVGYAWWKRGSAPDAGTVEGTVPSESVTADETVGAGVSGNVQYAGTDTSGEDQFRQPTTNAEWGALAVERVTTLGGFDATLAATAIGKFLARAALTDAEAAVVMSARALTGDPPVGGPWLIVHGPGAPPTTPPPAPTNLGAPTGLRITRNGGGTVGLDWNPLHGAVRYRATIRNTHTGYTSSKSATSSYTVYRRLRRGTTYQVWISGVTSAGRVGTRATVRFKVA